MTAIKELLDGAAGDDPDVSPDPSADLLRGRRALRRRRLRMIATPLALSTVFLTVVVLGARPDSPPSQHAVLHSPIPRIIPTVAVPVRLVAYTGEQPSGYRVAYVPAGWEIQGANPFAMTIAPVGFGDQEPASFVGKLIVMLRSSDDTGTPRGTARPVGDGTGYLAHTEGIVVLTYQDAAKHWIQLQVPPSLHWSDDDVATFGAGVEITRDASPGRG